MKLPTLRLPFFSKKIPPKTPKLSFMDKLKGVAQQRLQQKDISQLIKSGQLMEGLNIPPLHISHPLRSIAKKLKNDVYKIESSSIKRFHAIEARIIKENTKHIETYGSFPIDDSSCDVSDEANYWKFQTALRLDNLTRYCSNLKVAVANKEISEEALVEEKALTQLIDASLLGTGSERVSSHLRLYGPTFTQNELQMAFYTLYNAEVDAAAHALTSLPLEDAKRHKKSVPKSAKAYLLDKLELNSKSRCVFAWADPKFVGFEPLDDDARRDAVDVLRSRREFFEEGEVIAKMFAEAHKADTQLLHNDRDETRQNMRYGSVFLFATIIADWIICVW